MPDRSKFRRLATECLVFARFVYDPAEHAGLLIMAQRWYELAITPQVDCDAGRQQIRPEQKDGGSTCAYPGRPETDFSPC